MHGSAHVLPAWHVWGGTQEGEHVDCGGGGRTLHKPLRQTFGNTHWVSSVQDPGGGGGTAHEPSAWQIWGAVQGIEHTGGEGERFFATTATTMTATSIMTPMRGGGNMLTAWVISYYTLKHYSASPYKTRYGKQVKEPSSS